MEQTEKIKAILEAVASGKYSGVELEPSRKGKTISDMKKGKPVSTAKVDAIYTLLCELEGQAQEEKEQAQEQTVDKRIVELEQENTRLKAENESLRKEIEKMKEQKQEQAQEHKEQSQEQVDIVTLAKTVAELKAEMEQIKNKQEHSVKTSDHEIIMGWHIRPKKAGGVMRLYANKSIGGKQHIVYVGNDPAKAEVKIREYCAKKGLYL